MIKLLEVLGFKKESRNVHLERQKPICNLSPKNGYFNALALKLSDYAKANNYKGIAQIPKEEFEKIDNLIQTRLGIRVIYHPSSI